MLGAFTNYGGEIAMKAALGIDPSASRWLGLYVGSPGADGDQNEHTAGSYAYARQSITFEWVSSANPSAFAKSVDNESNFTSYLTEVTGTGVASLGALDTSANGDRFYIGYSVPFHGVTLTMDGSNVNGNAAILAAEYWDGSAWVTLDIDSDGTASSGATLAQSGDIKWGIPRDWAKKSLGTLGTLYWVRLNVSAVLSNPTNVDTALLLTAFARNDDLIRFDGLNGGTVEELGILDASTSGNCTFRGPLTAPDGTATTKVVGNGDSLELAAGQLVITPITGE